MKTERSLAELSDEERLELDYHANMREVRLKFNIDATNRKDRRTPHGKKVVKEYTRVMKLLDAEYKKRLDYILQVRAQQKAAEVQTEIISAHVVTNPSTQVNEVKPLRGQTRYISHIDESPFQHTEVVSEIDG